MRCARVSVTGAGGNSCANVSLNVGSLLSVPHTPGYDDVWCMCAGVSISNIMRQDHRRARWCKCLCPYIILYLYHDKGRINPFPSIPCICFCEKMRHAGGSQVPPPAHVLPSASSSTRTDFRNLCPWWLWGLWDDVSGGVMTQQEASTSWCWPRNDWCNKGQKLHANCALICPDMPWSNLIKEGLQKIGRVPRFPGHLQEKLPASGNHLLDHLVCAGMGGRDKASTHHIFKTSGREIILRIYILHSILVVLYCMTK